MDELKARRVLGDFVMVLQERADYIASVLDGTDDTCKTEPMPVEKIINAEGRLESHLADLSQLCDRFDELGGRVRQVVKGI